MRHPRRLVAVGIVVRSLPPAQVARHPTATRGRALPLVPLTLLKSRNILVIAAAVLAMIAVIVWVANR